MMFEKFSGEDPAKRKSDELELDGKMDENNIIPRDRKASGPIEIIASPSMLSWEPPPREPHLLDYIRILRKHQWLILTFLLTVVTLVSIGTFKMKPVYQATARIRLRGYSRDCAIPGRRLRGPI